MDLKPQTSKLPTTDGFAKIVGSTAEILVALYKNRLKLKGIDKGNPVLDSAVALDMQSVEIKKTLASSLTTTLSQTCEAVSVSLNQLKNLSQEKERVKKDFALSKEPALNELKSKTEELHTKRDQLANRYTELVDEQFKIMGNLLASNDTHSKTEITQKLAELNKKREKLSEDVVQYEKQYQHAETALNSLYVQVYEQAPDKSKLPTPTTPEATTRAAPGARS
ncbi:MAG: hypothetical protein JO149_02445 [Gammaproteobacteria bacterium]|nr:hypothetical protein [Gammaproteobacteria bacterium]